MLLLRPVHDDRLDSKLLAALGVAWGLWALAKLACVALLTPSAAEAVWALNAGVLRPFYVDGPPGLAVLAALGQILVPDTAFGLRLPVWALSLAIPFAVYALARPLVGARQAVWAGALAMLVPPVAMVGTRFDAAAPVVLGWVCALACLVRGHASGRARYWVLAGLCAALTGLMSPLAMAPLLGLLAVGVFTRPGRVMLLAPYGMLGLAVAVWGGLPLLLLALSGQGGDWGLQGFEARDAARQFGLLLAVISPLLVFGYLEAARIVLRRARAGDARLAMLAVAAAAFGVVVLGGVVLGHWPGAALAATCAVLTPFLPAAVEAFLVRARSVRDRRLRLGLAMAAPLLAVLTLGVLVLHTALWRSPERILPLAERWRLLGSYENLQRLTTPIQNAARALEPRPNVAVVVALGRDLGATLAWGSARLVFTQASSDDVARGYGAAQALWQRDDDALLDQAAGRPAVVAVPRLSGLYANAAAVADRTRLCQRVQGLQYLKTISLSPGRRQIDLFSGTVRAEPGPLPVGCAVFPSLLITTPTPGVVTAGQKLVVEGVAVALSGVVQLEVLVDGAPAALAHYGFEPKGQTIPPALMFDPNVPDVGFAAVLSDLKPGMRRLSIRALRTDGRTETSADQIVYVR